MDIHFAERLGAIDQKAEAAHKRLDSMQGEFRDSLREMSKDVKDLIAKDNRAQGRNAVLLVLASVIGAALSAVISYVLK